MELFYLYKFFFIILFINVIFISFCVFCYIFEKHDVNKTILLIADRDPAGVVYRSCMYIVHMYILIY